MHRVSVICVVVRLRLRVHGKFCSQLAATTADLSLAKIFGLLKLVKIFLYQLKQLFEIIREYFYFYLYR